MIELYEKPTKVTLTTISNVLGTHEAFYIEEHHLLVVEQSDDTLAVISPHDEVLITVYTDLPQLCNDYAMPNDQPVIPVSNIGLQYEKSKY